MRTPSAIHYDISHLPFFPVLEESKKGEKPFPVCVNIIPNPCEQPDEALEHETILTSGCIPERKWGGNNRMER